MWPQCQGVLRRVFEIQPLFARAWTTAELAEHLGASQRTIQRDLAELQEEPTYAPLIRRQRTVEVVWRLMSHEE